MSVRSLAVLFAVALLATPLMAQTREYGDGVGIGGILLPSGSHTILGKMRLGDAMALEGMFSLNHASENEFSSTDFMIGAGILAHWNANEKVQPYWGGRLTVTSWSRDLGGAESSDTGIGLIGVLGAEYFITRRISCEGEVGLGFHFGSFEIRTSSSLAAFIYL